MNIQDFCFKKSMLLRLRRKDSIYLINLAVGFLPRKPWDVSQRSLGLLRQNLRSTLENDVRRSYGNPLVIFILLKIIIPIVVQLVIRWWLSRSNDWN